MENVSQNRHPFQKRGGTSVSHCEYLPSYLRPLQMDVLRVTGAQWRRERSWKFPFFPFKPQIGMILAVCQICFKLLLTKNIFFVLVIVHKSFVL